MDTLITIVRIPIAIVAGLLLVILGWPFELLIGVIALPFNAVFRSRENLKIAYGSWPMNTVVTLGNLREWVFRDDEPYLMNDGLGSFIKNVTGLDAFDL
jgi:hypothetical protein